MAAVMYGNDRVMYSYVARCVLASLPLRGVGGRTGFMAQAPLAGRGESWAASYPWACSQSSGIFVCGQKGKGTEPVSFVVLFRGKCWVSFGQIVSVLSGYWRQGVHYGMINIYIYISE